MSYTVEEIINTSKLLSDAHKDTLLKCAHDTQIAENSVKKTTICAKCGVEMLYICPLCKNIAS